MAKTQQILVGSASASSDRGQPPTKEGEVKKIEVDSAPSLVDGLLENLVEAVDEKLDLGLGNSNGSERRVEQEQLVNDGRAFAVGDCTDSQGVINAGYSKF